MNRSGAFVAMLVLGAIFAVVLAFWPDRKPPEEKPDDHEDDRGRPGQ